MKRLAHRLAILAEWIFDKLFGRTGEDRLIEPYIGYATPTHLVVRGRVLTALRRNEPVPHQRWWTNLRQMISLFLTDEVAHVEVAAQGHSTQTDEEGYFTLHLPREEAVDWHEVPVTVTGHRRQTMCPVMVPAGTARFVVISDIDDTLMETGAYSLARNLWTSMTGNTLTRHIFPDAIALVDHLTSNGRNPIFYVSSSPWNLHHFLKTIFDNAGLARGPKFLRDLGISNKQFVTGTHSDHKSGSIDTILEALPDLPVILMGDTGQHDAEVYLDAIDRYPGRVKAVILREPGPGPKKQARIAMEKLRATDVPLLHGKDFTDVVQDLNLD